MATKLGAPLRRPVNDPRYSDCSGRLEDLDWGNWWTDAFETNAWRYIHVASAVDDSVQRVRPKLRKGQRARIAFRDGVLYWLIDRDRPLPAFAADHVTTEDAE